MTKTRVEAFSDGVIAIIITIMVLEMKVPHGADPAELRPLIPVMLSYVLSYIYLGIYWSNHHHLLQAVKKTDGGILWANLHLLFWLSLVPFVTSWMGENHFATWPVVFYGIVLLCCGIAYSILVRTLIANEGKDSPLAKALGKDLKGNISVACYVAALALAVWNRYLACALYAVVALMWLVPDKRIENKLIALHQGQAPEEPEGE